MPTASTASIVFADRPLFGVGPGAAGAWMVAHHPDHPYVSRFNAAANAGTRDLDIETLRRIPLSTVLYLEVLSEWGLVGFLAWGLYLYLLLLRGDNRGGREFAVALAFVYLTSQTLPRFDLWLLVGFAAWIRKPGGAHA